MKYRNIELYHELSLDDVGTKIIDLRTKEPLSAIRLNFLGTNGATSCCDNRLNDVVTKIELVDGSDQLISLSLKEAQAIEFRRKGTMPFMRPGEKASGGQDEAVMIIFGRFLFDPDFYLDLDKFRNPQLKITTNIAAIAAASATAFLTGSLKVTVDLLTMAEGAQPSKGFMMQKNIYGFTSGTSGDEHIDMPRDYPYVGLLMRAFVAGNDVDENISNLKLSCDAGKFIPLDKGVKELYKAEEQERGPAELRYNIFRGHGATVTHDLNHDPVVSVIPVSAGVIANIGWSWSSRFYLSLLTHAGANQTDAIELGLIVKGSCPHATIYIPFGIEVEEETYFNPKDYGDIDLILTQAAASAVSVCLIQLRDYGAAE